MEGGNSLMGRNFLQLDMERKFCLVVSVSGVGKGEKLKRARKQNVKLFIFSRGNRSSMQKASTVERKVSLSESKKSYS